MTSKIISHCLGKKQLESIKSIIKSDTILSVVIDDLQFHEEIKMKNYWESNNKNIEVFARTNYIVLCIIDRLKDIDNRYYIFPDGKIQELD